MSAPTSTVWSATRGVLGWLRQAVAASGDQPGDPDPVSRWRSVTIDRGQEEVAPGGRVPEPLASLGDAVEVRVRTAPGGRGTELAARLRRPRPAGSAPVAGGDGDEDPSDQVRSALRQAKQLIEVGEVLRVEPQPHGHRPSTPGGALVDTVTRRADGKGLL